MADVTGVALYDNFQSSLSAGVVLIHKHWQGLFQLHLDHFGLSYNFLNHLAYTVASTEKTPLDLSKRVGGESNGGCHWSSSL